jgi:hypothetical protein
MSAVLRGHGGLTFEQSLEALAAAANKELPRHLAMLPEGQRMHLIVAPAFVTGVGPRLYSIDNMVTSTGHWCRYKSRPVRADSSSLGSDLAFGGTGGEYLAGKKDRSWERDLRSLVKAHDRGRISAHVVADQLAQLNYEAHQKVGDGSVGPRCIVVWRRRPDARHPGPGGAQQYYTGVERELGSDPIPTLTNGMDVRSIAGVLQEYIHGQLSDQGFFDPGSGTGVAVDFDEDEINRQLAELPHQPDDKLR